MLTECDSFGSGPLFEGDARQTYSCVEIEDVFIFEFLAFEDDIPGEDDVGVPQFEPAETVREDSYICDGGLHFKSVVQDNVSVPELQDEPVVHLRDPVLVLRVLVVPHPITIYYLLHTKRRYCPELYLA